MAVAGSPPRCVTSLATAGVISSPLENCWLSPGYMCHIHVDPCTVEQRRDGGSSRELTSLSASRRQKERHTGNGKRILKPQSLPLEAPHLNKAIPPGPSQTVPSTDQVFKLMSL